MFGHAKRLFLERLSLTPISFRILETREREREREGERARATVQCLSFRDRANVERTGVIRGSGKLYLHVCVYVCMLAKGYN